MTLSYVPPTLRQYRVPREALEDTWEFLRERGRIGVEGVVLWVGEVLDEERAVVVVAVPPRQLAYRGEDGLAVEIPQDALTELIGALPLGVHVLARVHSHSMAAYHSSLDDTNMVISHAGAISIVVPDFANGPVGLVGCSVNELGADGGWRELSAKTVSERFVVA
jgi:hypothetical protein